MNLQNGSPYLCQISQVLPFGQKAMFSVGIMSHAGEGQLRSSVAPIACCSLEPPRDAGTAACPD